MSLEAIKRYSSTALLVGLSSVLIMCGFVGAADWPIWQGPNRDAKSTETGLLKKWPDGGPEMLWSVDGIGAGYSSVTIADGLIYISGTVDKEGFITAIQADGSVKWRKPYGPEWTKSFPGARSSVTIDSGKLYVFSGTGVVASLDAKTGDKKWSVDVMEKFGGKHHFWGYGESLLVIDDKVICTAGGEGASMVALSVSDGSTVWTTKELNDQAAFCSPIVVDRGGKKMIIQMLQKYVVGVNAADGSVMCKYDTNDYQSSGEKFGGCHTNTPVYHNGFIYLTSGYDAGSAKLKLSDDGTEITKVWLNYDLDVHHGGVVLVDGHIYGSNWISNSKGVWLCVDWETGETKYEQDWDGNKGSIGYADGMLYCYQEKKGNLDLIKPMPEKFDIVSSFEITMGQEQHWAHPVICGGVLYMRHGDVLMAYDVKN